MQWAKFCPGKNSLSLTLLQQFCAIKKAQIILRCQGEFQTTAEIAKLDFKF